MAESSSRSLVTLGRMETLYGDKGGVAVFDLATTGLNLYENTAPYTANIGRVVKSPLRRSLSPVKGRASIKTANFNAQAVISGAQDLGAATEVPWQEAIMLRACGFQETLVAGTSYGYTLRSSAFESIAMEYYNDGYLFELAGMVGDCTINGTVGEPVTLDFAMQCLYEDPTIVANPNPTDIPEDNVQLLDANVTFDRGGGPLATFAVIDFTVALNNQISIKRDANSVSGISRLRISDRSPTLRLQVYQDSALGFHPLEDQNAGQLYEITMRLNPGAAANLVVATMPEWEITGVSHGDADGLKTWTIEGQLTSAAGDTEASLLFS